MLLFCIILMALMDFRSDIQYHSMIMSVILILYNSSIKYLLSEKKNSETLTLA